MFSISQDALTAFNEIPADAISLLHSRTEVMQLLTLDREIDVIVPRGSREFVRYIAQHSRIPVLGHGEGICHIYVDAAANLSKAIDVTIDSKVQYPAACNSVETLLVHQAIAAQFLASIARELMVRGVEIRGCAHTVAIVSDLRIQKATEQDWSTEYSDLILSVKVVDDLDAAIEHINTYGSRHTEAIVTEDEAAADRFMSEVDAASSFHNASTRFADGFRYGLGAELGISNGKIHARGPVGLEGLTTYKYQLFGNGQVVATYASGQRHFKHEVANN